MAPNSLLVFGGSSVLFHDYVLYQHPKFFSGEVKLTCFHLFFASGFPFYELSNLLSSISVLNCNLVSFLPSLLQFFNLHLTCRLPTALIFSIPGLVCNFLRRLSCLDYFFSLSRTLPFLPFILSYIVMGLAHSFGSSTDRIRRYRKC